MEHQDRSETASIHTFYQGFQEEYTALSNLIDSLSSSFSEFERQAVIDKCLSKINQLSDDVKDASSYLPAYDQRKYSEHLKALSDQLSQIRKSLTPKQKFSFKSKPSFKQKPSTPSPTLSSTFTFTTAAQNSIQISSKISSKFNSYIDSTILNNTQSSSILLSNLTQCLVNLLPSNPTATSALSSTTAAIKTLTRSLLLLHTNGPVHLTNIQSSTLVLSCRQFRMHDSKNTKVYLFCTSRPIIEDCSGIEFAPFPLIWINNKLPVALSSTKNLWDKIDDFKWLKHEHSPNWSVIPEEKRISEGKFDQFDESLARAIQVHKGGLGTVQEMLPSFGIIWSDAPVEDEEEI